MTIGFVVKFLVNQIVSTQFIDTQYQHKYITHFYNL